MMSSSLTTSQVKSFPLEELIETNFLSLLDEELVDEEEIEYEEEEEIEESEDISDIDDDDLMKRLEAKYGKISGENSEDEDDPDGSWTSNYKIVR
jgi:hypothetical protein